MFKGRRGDLPAIWRESPFRPSGEYPALCLVRARGASACQIWPEIPSAWCALIPDGVERDDSIGLSPPGKGGRRYGYQEELRRKSEDSAEVQVGRHRALRLAALCADAPEDDREGVEVKGGFVPPSTQ